MKHTLINDPDALLEIIKSLPGNFLILLPDAPRYTIVEVSEEYNIATLTERESIIGAGIFDVFPDDPEDLDANGVKNLSASLKKVLETRQTDEMPVQRYPVPNPDTDGFLEKFWMSVNKPVMVGDSVAYIIHSAIDVTASKLLKLREQYLKSLADGSPFMILRFAGASCIYVNDTWSAITGLSQADSLGLGYQQSIHPRDLAEQRESILKSFNLPAPYETKFRIIDKNGFARWCLMKSTPNFIDGPVVEYIVTMIDIHDQEIASQWIVESEKQFRQLADSIIQMIWVTDANGMHEYYNQRWYDFTGTTPEETAGEGWSSAFHPDDQQRAWKIWRNSLDTGTPYEIEYRLRKYTGEYIWVLGRAAPFYDSVGKIIKWFGTCTDIHEQKLLQQQKDEFINIASHELKTPITGLKANIQLVQRALTKKPDTDPVLLKMMRSCQNNVNKLTHLIDELLNANSIGIGQLKINKEWFDLCELVRETVAYLTTEQTPLRITGPKTIHLFADPLKIEQVIINLVNNAHKYAHASEYIEIRIEDADNEVSVKVIDQGSGIADDKHEFLFDRYYQLESKGVRYSGMGLGLYICSSIVKAHEGQIGVESQLGKGSTFWFSLPKQEA